LQSEKLRTVVQTKKTVGMKQIDDNDFETVKSGFQQIESLCARMTSGNVSHLSANARVICRVCAELLSQVEGE
jgi:ribosomal protein S20